MAGFLKEHYGNPVALPKRLLVSVLPEEHEVLEDWLSDKAEHRVEIRQPLRGDKKKLLELALKNARQALEMETVMPSRYESRREGLAELEEALELDGPPWRIEWPIRQRTRLLSSPVCCRGLLRPGLTRSTKIN